MCCLLPIGLGLYLSDASRAAGTPMIIIGSVACGLFLITCTLVCCKSLQEEAQQTVQAVRPTLHIRSPRVEEEQLPELVPDTVVNIKPTQSSSN